MSLQVTHCPCLPGQNAQAGGPLKGAAFWNWLADGQQAPAAEGGGSGLYGIKVEDTTFNYIRDNANFMRSCGIPACFLSRAA